MSKVTSQDVIDEGAYLEPGFKPASLLVPHLRAVLQNHDVPYPATASKAQLINLFNEHIAPNAEKFKKARRVNAAIPSDASDIMDGETGAYIEPRPAGRRLTRQSSGMAPARVPSASPTRKPRRSAVTPRTSMKATRDDTSEEESDARARNGTPTAGDRRRGRVSQKWGAKDDTSRWEDNNPFQRASLTPDKEVADHKPRKSRGGRPSNFYEPTSEPQPPQQIFPMTGSLQLPSPPRVSPRASYDEYNPVLAQSTPGKFETSYTGVSDETLDGHSMAPQDDESDYNNVISQKIAALGTGESGTLAPISRNSGPSMWVRLFLSILAVMGTGVLWVYKEDSASLGYCDAGKNTNFKVLEALEEINRAEECKKRLLEQTRAGDTSLESCKTSFIPRATQCTPCPAHASCSVHFVTCEPAYKPQRHSLSSIPMLDRALDGLPGLGSVALPVECVPDARRRHNVGKMGRLIENRLAGTRGQRICDGVESAGGDAQDAAAYGERTEDIRMELRKKVKAIHNFDEIFNQAISELKSTGLLVSVHDITGHEQLASIRQEVTYYCQAKLVITNTWQTWQRTVIATLFAGLLIIAARSRLAKSTLERRRVRGLVKDVLERVRAQEARHYLDPVGYPSAVLSSLQLRDEVMADEHSIVTRQRLWQQVEKVVEENSNLRSNMEVMPTGDEGRVWTWIGSGNRSIEFGDETRRRVM